MPTQAFHVERGTTIVSGATATITEGAEYTLPAGATASNTWVRITNTRLTGNGRTSGGGNQNVDDFTAYVSNPSNVLTSITFERHGTGSTNTRVDWEIVTYVGSGDNEVIVRDVGTASGTAITISGTQVTTISDASQVLVLITGQRSNNTDRNDWHTGLFTAALNDDGGGNYTPQFTRGEATSTGSVSYAVIEFTGSNWRPVQRLAFTNSGIGGSVWSTGAQTVATTFTLASVGGSDLLDASKAFLHCQYTYGGGTAGLDDSGENVEIASATQLTHRCRAVSDSTLRQHVVWIIENTQADGTARNLVSEQIAFYIGTGGTEEDTRTQACTAVDSIDESSIWGECCSCDGGGTALPRGANTVRLTATDTVTWVRSDNGQEQRMSWQVVQWPEDPDGGTPPQNFTQDATTTATAVGNDVTFAPQSTAFDQDATAIATATGLDATFAPQLATFAQDATAVSTATALDATFDLPAIFSGDTATATAVGNDATFDPQSATLVVDTALSTGVAQDATLSASGNAPFSGNTATATATGLDATFSAGASQFAGDTAAAPTLALDATFAAQVATFAGDTPSASAQGVDAVFDVGSLPSQPLVGDTPSATTVGLDGSASATGTAPLAGDTADAFTVATDATIAGSGAATFIGETAKPDVVALDASFNTGAGSYGVGVLEDELAAAASSVIGAPYDAFDDSVRPKFFRVLDTGTHPILAPAARRAFAKVNVQSIGSVLTIPSSLGFGSGSLESGGSIVRLPLSPSTTETPFVIVTTDRHDALPAVSVAAGNIDISLRLRGVGTPVAWTSEDTEASVFVLWGQAGMANWSISNIIDELDAAASATIGAPYDTYSSDIRDNLFTVIATALESAVGPFVAKATARITTDGASNVSLVDENGIFDASIVGSVMTIRFDNTADVDGTVNWCWHTSMGASAGLYMITAEMDTDRVYLTLRNASTGATASWETIATEFSFVASWA